MAKRKSKKNEDRPRGPHAHTKPMPKKACDLKLKRRKDGTGFCYE